MGLVGIRDRVTWLVGSFEPLSAKVYNDVDHKCDIGVYMAVPEFCQIRHVGHYHFVFIPEAPVDDPA